MASQLLPLLLSPTPSAIGKPLGYLATPWKSEWVKVKDVEGSAEMSGDVARISLLLPQLDATGKIVKKSAQGALVTIEVPVTYSDE